jgi:hypothetical protein
MGRIDGGNDGKWVRQAAEGLVRESACQLKCCLLDEVGATFVVPPFPCHSLLRPPNNTATVTPLTAINKKLVETAARGKPSGPPTGPPNPVRAPNLPFPGNYCWTHGHRVSQHHTSATCGSKAPGHKDDATAANTMGGSKKDKGWKPAAAGWKPAAAKT